MQIKTIMKYHFSHINLARTNARYKIKSGEETEKQGESHTTKESARGYVATGKKRALEIFSILGQ